MKVSELIRKLKTLPQDLEIVQSLDIKGENVYPVDNAHLGVFYREDFEIFDVEEGDTPNAVCIWPAR